MLELSRASLIALSLVLAGAAQAAETTIDLSGAVAEDEYRHFSIPFEVPAGTLEIAVQQQSLVAKNILDFGIMDPTRAWRGWGGSRIEDVVINEKAATRSHVPGPIQPGTWQIVVGEAAVPVKPATFSLVVTLRDTVTLPPQTDRKPYVPSPPLSTEARWYAGDFHVHSIESNDASPTFDEIADYAKGRGLDFVHISDHNIHTQLDYLTDAQAKHPTLLFVPGAEYTTYWGHASAVGATQWVDDRTELPGHGIVQAVEQYREQGAFFSINHPELRLGDQCIGCAWEQDLPVEYVDGVEIGTGKLAVFNEDAVLFWDELSKSGRHIVALAGSDDHSAGTNTSPTSSPIGSPTTMVFATELSVAGIMAGLRAGRTVVKLSGPMDPMIEVVSSVAPEGDTVKAKTTKLTATVTGGIGHTVRWVKNGQVQPDVAVEADPQVIELEVTAPESGEDRWRAEALINGRRRTVTSHLFIAPPAAGASEESDSGCGCRMRGPGAPLSLGALALLLVLGLSRRR